MSETLVSVFVFYLFFLSVGSVLGGTAFWKIFRGALSPLSSFTAGAVFFLPFCLLLLYYLLWLLPTHSPLFYLAALLAALLFATAFLYKQVPPFLQEAQTEGSNFLKPFLVPVFFLLIFPLLLMGVVWLSMSKAFTEHDAMEYAVYGNLMADKAGLYYQRHPFDAATGFYYAGLHGPAFPLLRTFEVFLGSLLPLKDVVFRSLNGIAGLLLIGTCGVSAAKKSRRFALWMMFSLSCSYVFIFTFLQVSLDHFRMMQLFAFALIWYETRHSKLSNAGIVLLWLTAGMAGFAHSLNMLLLSGFFVIHLIFSKEKQQAGYVFFSALGFTLGGGLHYLIDTLAGTGWIFQ